MITRILLALLVCLLKLSSLSAYDYRFSVAAIFQNEAPYLKEWIEFHRLVGVEHFYLYNDKSTDNYREVLSPYIKEGLVEVINWPNRWSNILFSAGCQTEAYNDAIARSTDKTKWLALLDIDEYLFPVENYNLADLLEQEYKNYVGITVNWQMYGTSHIQKLKKDKLMVEQLVMKAPKKYWKNYYCKSIVQPKYVANCPNPYFCRYKEGYQHIYPNKQYHNSSRMSNKVYVDKLRINHYWTRDRDFFNRVRLKRCAFLCEDSPLPAEVAAELNAVEDKAIFKYVYALHTVIFLEKILKEIANGETE